MVVSLERNLLGTVAALNARHGKRAGPRRIRNLLVAHPLVRIVPTEPTSVRIRLSYATRHIFVSTEANQIVELMLREYILPSSNLLVHDTRREEPNDAPLHKLTKLYTVVDRLGVVLRHIGSKTIEADGGRLPHETENSARSQLETRVNKFHRSPIQSELEKSAGCGEGRHSADRERRTTQSRRELRIANHRERIVTATKEMFMPRLDGIATSF